MSESVLVGVVWDYRRVPQEAQPGAARYFAVFADHLWTADFRAGPSPNRPKAGPGGRRVPLPDGPLQWRSLQSIYIIYYILFWVEGPLPPPLQYAYVWECLYSESLKHRFKWDVC